MKVATKKKCMDFKYLPDKINIICDCLERRFVVRVGLSHTHIDFFHSFENIEYVRNGVPLAFLKFTVVQLDEKSKLSIVMRKTFDCQRCP